MTEKVLPYDRKIVTQETGYWCGPAATQVVLNSRGIIVPEADLAREIGTTTRGTDYVGLIERILDRRTPDAQYTSVYLEQDPPTQAQKDRLWTHLTRSINAGYGVVTNWVAPPSNKPRGVKGSVSPRYSGGTTYHYVAAMGYSDDDGFRAVWIADSGFQPQGYWVSFDQYASLITPKGYCYADLQTAVPAPPPSVSPPPAALLSKAMGDTLSLVEYAKLAPAYAKALLQMGATNNNRIAMVSAQFGHESVGFKYRRELWGPTKDQLNYDNMMGNGPGEGRKYLGRGPIQVTGKNNYRALSQWAHGKGYISSPTLFVDQPELLETDEYLFLPGVWYLTVSQPKFMEYADAGNIEDASKAINAPAWIGTANRARGIEDRIARWNRCRTMDLMPLLREEDDPLSDPVIVKLIEEIHRETVQQKSPSRSFMAEDGKLIDTPLGINWNTDGNAWTLVLTEAYRLDVPKAVEVVEHIAEHGVYPGTYASEEYNQWLREFGQAYCQGLVREREAYIAAREAKGDN